jgi:group I intron endonuclease
MASNYKCYKITNKINGKVYIGYTKKSVDTRFREHVKVSRGKGYKCSFQYAILKYGKDNFEVQVLDDNLTKKNACMKEIEYIVLYDSRKNGYNETSGGDGGCDFKIKTTTIIKVLNDYVSGMSINDVARKHALSYHSVFDITRFRFSDEHDVPKSLRDAVRAKKKRSKKRKKILGRDIVGILEYFISGNTITSTALKYGISVPNAFSIIWRETFSNIPIEPALEKKLIEYRKQKKFWKREVK